MKDSWPKWNKFILFIIFTMHMFHVPQCPIQNRNVHIPVLNYFCGIRNRCILGFMIELLINTSDDHKLLTTDINTPRDHLLFVQMSKIVELRTRNWVPCRRILLILVTCSPPPPPPKILPEKLLMPYKLTAKLHAIPNRCRDFNFQNNFKQSYIQLNHHSETQTSKKHEASVGHKFIEFIEF